MEDWRILTNSTSLSLFNSSADLREVKETLYIKYPFDLSNLDWLTQSTTIIFHPTKAKHIKSSYYFHLEIHSQYSSCDLFDVEYFMLQSALRYRGPTSGPSVRSYRGGSGVFQTDPYWRLNLKRHTFNFSTLLSHSLWGYNTRNANKHTSSLSSRGLFRSGPRRRVCADC